MSMRSEKDLDEEYEHLKYVAINTTIRIGAALSAATMAVTVFFAQFFAVRKFAEYVNMSGEGRFFLQMVGCGFFLLLVGLCIYIISETIDESRRRIRELKLKKIEKGLSALQADLEKYSLAIKAAADGDKLARANQDRRE
ncbi:MAG: hypothetical protein JWO15_3590 [Sphingomonadales bacterium]|nr:hypothetical protein [Sphingomonadales bacterium]